MPRPQRRRLSVLIFGVLATAIALTGCTTPGGGPSTEPGVTADSESLLPAAEGLTHYPLTFETPFGTTELSERPERIAFITASTIDTEAALALDAIPVFAPDTLTQASSGWFDPDQVDSIETLWESSSGTDISAEQIAASEPDLIVSLWAYDTFDQSRFDQLEMIAPVLYSPLGALTWREVTLAIGEALDLQEAAEKAIESYDEHIMALRAEHPEFEGKTAAFVNVYNEEYGVVYFSTPGNGSALLLEDLGFRLPDAAEQFAESSSVSLEQVGLIDADVLFIGGDPENTDRFLAEPVVQTVPAVADGRFAVIENSPDANLPWALASASVTSLKWAADFISEYAAPVLADDN